MQTVKYAKAQAARQTRRNARSGYYGRLSSKRFTVHFQARKGGMAVIALNK